MKKTILSFFILLITICTFAQKVNLDQAKIVAQNIITERFENLVNNPAQYKIQSFSTEYLNGTEVFYIFNLAPTGFVIVSADMSYQPILAFSYESDFDADNLFVGLNLWMQDYATQIERNIRYGIRPEPKLVQNWEALMQNPETYKSDRQFKTVGKLLNTKWNQGRYYNSHCPQDAAGTDGRVVVGCVATALGQLMNYFRFPSTGIGSYGYEHPVYGWLEVDFSQQTYDYDFMPVSPSDYSDNLAKLLYNIGVSVDMNYGPSGSGMYNHKGAYTLRTYFGYKPETTYLFRDSLDIDFDWYGTLVEHLDQKIPLYYAGWSDYDFIMGHAFILDGYSDSTHYHINWGWGGSSDGYFFIDNLRPGGSDFTLLHEVIAYAIPDSEPNYCEGQKIINSREGIINDGSGPLNFYQNDTECSWLIYSSDSVSGYKFNFLNFELDDDDYVIFFDGETDEAPVIATVFGGDELVQIVSSSEKVLIKFVTDSDSVNYGWNLKYEFIKPIYCTLTTTLTAENGYVTDGSNSYQYHNSTFCNWTIQPTGAENILITFLEFDIEPIKDYVKIFNASNQTLANLSGNILPDPILVVGNKATVSFRSDNNIRAGGFKLYYEINQNSVESTKLSGIKIFPNPATDILTIEIPESTELIEINIISYDGRILKSIKSKQHTIDISEFGNGIYIIEINTSKFTSRQSLIKIN